MPKKFHLSWFMNFSPDAWDSDFSAGGSPWDGRFHTEMAVALERACFDYIMLEDTLMVSESYGETAEITLKHALQVPKHDPMPLAAADGRRDHAISASSPPCPPWPIRRSCWRGCRPRWTTSAGGRFGWNIVTSGEDIAAQNFGMEKLPPREARYEMADEYVELVRRLFDTWEPDAVVMDRETGYYADFTQGQSDPFRGQVFPLPRPAEHRALAAGTPGFRAGRRLAARAGIRRAQRRLDHRHGQRLQGHEVLPRRRARPRRRRRPRSGRHQGAVPDLPDHRRDAGGSLRQAPPHGELPALHRARAGQHQHRHRHRFLASSRWTNRCRR